MVMVRGVCVGVTNSILYILIKLFGQFIVSPNHGICIAQPCFLVISIVNSTNIYFFPTANEYSFHVLPLFKIRRPLPLPLNNIGGHVGIRGFWVGGALKRVMCVAE